VARASAILAIRYAHPLEQVGGALETALGEGGWKIDLIEREDGEIRAGKRGWFGYRTIDISLEAQGNETEATYTRRCKTDEFDALVRAVEIQLSV